MSNEKKEEFTTAIHFNHKSQAIELTKKFDKAASRYGSKEYAALQDARRDYPEYRVVVKETAKRQSRFKGLTYDRMEKYIKAHDASLLPDFYTLTGKVDGVGFISPASYGEVRQWFLNKFDFHSREAIDSILGKNAA